MGCEITGGRKIPCKDGAAGLLAVYFVNQGYDNPVFEGTKVKDLQLKSGGAVTLFKYELDNVGNLFDEALEASRDNGTFYNMQTLTLALQTLQDSDFEEVQTLAKGRPAAFVQYRNGKVRMAGLSRGLDTAGTNNSGGDLGDFQGFNLTMTAKENDYAPLMVGSTIQNPFGGWTTQPTIVEVASDQS